MTKTRKLISKFIDFDPIQRKDVVCMVFIIIKISLIVKLFPLKYYYKNFLAEEAIKLLDLQPFKKEIDLLHRLMKQTPWEITCLMRCMIIKKYLFKYEISLPIMIGITKTDPFQAHAWYNASSINGISKLPLQ